jgi:hypothetical protein
LFGEWPDRAEVLAFDDRRAVGDTPHPQWIGIEALAVGRLSAQPDLAGAENPAREVAHY